MIKIRDLEYYNNLKLDIYLPDSDTFDLLIYFHGGGLESGGKEEIIPSSDYLVERNIAIISINYRLYPFAKYPDGFKKAIYYLDMLEKYKKEMKPFQFIISRTLQNGEVPFYTNMKMSLEDYSVEDNVNEGFDIKVSVNLTQYKAYGTKTVDISEYVTKTESSTSDEGKRTAGDGAATTGTAYTIASGDTLWNIAKKKLGNGTKWTAIYDANKSTIESAAKSRGRSSSSNGHWIYPGTVITIP